MSLGHVYIVLEPAGSARLTFGDDRYYEFMCFGDRTLFQVPNEFREVPNNYRSAGGLSEPPGKTNGPSWALVGREGSKEVWGVPSQEPNRIGLGLWGAAPSFLLPSSSLPLRPNKAH